MQATSGYLSTMDLWALAVIAVVVAILAANCSYQKRRSLARDRIAARAERTAHHETRADGGVAAHA